MVSSDRTKEMPVELSVLRARQHSQHIYIGAMPASLLCSPWGKAHIRPDRWKPDNDDGYQRDPVKARVNDFAKYVGNGRHSPTAILLNIRGGDAEFKPFPGSREYGRLVLPKGTVLYEVDGQHRVEGMRVAFEKNPKMDFAFPVVILQVSRYDEAIQFAVINKTQKGLRTELTDRVLHKIMDKEDALTRGSLPSIIRRDEWRVAAGRLVEVLKDDPVWRGRIKAPNSPRDPRNVVSEGAVVMSLQPLVQKFNLSDKTVPRAGAVLRAYWKAVAMRCPKATVEEPQSYALMRTLGVGVVHRLFLDVLEVCDTYHKGARDAKTFAKVLASAKGFTDKAWDDARILGTGKAAESALHRQYRDAIMAVYEGHEESRLLPQI